MRNQKKIQSIFLLCTTARYVKLSLLLVFLVFWMLFLLFLFVLLFHVVFYYYFNRYLLVFHVLCSCLVLIGWLWCFRVWFAMFALCFYPIAVVCHINRLLLLYYPSFIIKSNPIESWFINQIKLSSIIATLPSLILLYYQIYYIVPNPNITMLSTIGDSIVVSLAWFINCFIQIKYYNVINYCHHLYYYVNLNQSL